MHSVPTDKCEVTLYWPKDGCGTDVCIVYALCDFKWVNAKCYTIANWKTWRKVMQVPLAELTRCFYIIKACMDCFKFGCYYLKANMCLQKKQPLGIGLKLFASFNVPQFFRRVFGIRSIIGILYMLKIWMKRTSKCVTCHFLPAITKPWATWWFCSTYREFIFAVFDVG